MFLPRYCSEREETMRRQLHPNHHLEGSHWTSKRRPVYYNTNQVQKDKA